jgi:TonB family protein
VRRVLGFGLIGIAATRRPSATELVTGHIRQLSLAGCLALAACATASRATQSAESGPRFPNAGQLTIAMAGDSLPRPARIDRGPRYPVGLRGEGVAGQLMAAFVIDSTGRVEFSSITFVESAHADFHKSVCDFLRDARFVPPRSDGVPQRTLVFMPFRFWLSTAPPLGPQTNVQVYQMRARQLPREELIAELEKGPHC